MSEFWLLVHVRDPEDSCRRLAFVFCNLHHPGYPDGGGLDRPRKDYSGTRPYDCFAETRRQN